jgi:hypothetical protein
MFPSCYHHEKNRMRNEQKCRGISAIDPVLIMKYRVSGTDEGEQGRLPPAKQGSEAPRLVNGGHGASIHLRLQRKMEVYTVCRERRGTGALRDTAA